MAFPENQETKNTEINHSPDLARSERPSEGGRVEIEANKENQESRAQMQNENRTGRETFAFPSATVPASPVPSAAAKPESLVQIEHILQDGLMGVYQQLDDKGKEKMKLGGEKAANKIDQLIKSTKITAKKVLDIIRNWLKSIPGVNKHFFEQEAKIKTDQILAMNRNKKP
jgi:hypothetical protein